MGGANIKSVCGNTIVRFPKSLGCFTTQVTQTLTRSKRYLGNKNAKVLFPGLTFTVYLKNDSEANVFNDFWRETEGGAVPFAVTMLWFGVRKTLVLSAAADAPSIYDGSKRTITLPCKVLSVDEPWDNTPPILTLNGAAHMDIAGGDNVWVDPKATAIDNVEGDISGRVVVTGDVDMYRLGDYDLEYNVQDSSGNDAIPVYRTVSVTSIEDNYTPIINIIGDNPSTVINGDTYIDDGATAHDTIDGDLTSSIVGTGTVDTSTDGEYTITYTVSDAAGHQATANRTVNVIAQPDTTAPVITLLGNATETITEGDNYVDAGATAIDDTDGDITDKITVSGLVDSSAAGTYHLYYNVSDQAGNAAAQVTRTVVVEAGVAYGAEEFDTSGTHSLTVPAGVTEIRVCAIAGGGPGYNNIDGDAGMEWGGGYAGEFALTTLSVAPSDAIDVEVGSKGTVHGAAPGGDTIISVNGAEKINLKGGQPGDKNGYKGDGGAGPATCMGQFKDGVKRTKDNSGVTITYYGGQAGFSDGGDVGAPALKGAGGMSNAKDGAIGFVKIEWGY